MVYEIFHSKTRKTPLTTGENSSGKSYLQHLTEMKLRRSSDVYRSSQVDTGFCRCPGLHGKNLRIPNLIVFIAFYTFCMHTIHTVNIDKNILL